jgi:hypothetical protein
MKKEKEKPMKRVVIQKVDFDGWNFLAVRNYLKQIEKENPQYKELKFDVDYDTDYDGNRNNTLEVIGFREKTAEEIKAEKKAQKESDKEWLEQEKKTYLELKKKFEKE